MATLDDVINSKPSPSKKSELLYEALIGKSEPCIDKSGLHYREATTTEKSFIEVKKKDLIRCFNEQRWDLLHVLLTPEVYYESKNPHALSMLRPAREALVNHLLSSKHRSNKETHDKLMIMISAKPELFVLLFDSFDLLKHPSRHKQLPTLLTGCFQQLSYSDGLVEFLKCATLKYYHSLPQNLISIMQRAVFGDLDVGLSRFNNGPLEFIVDDDFAGWQMDRLNMIRWLTRIAQLNSKEGIYGHALRTLKYYIEQVDPEQALSIMSCLASTDALKTPATRALLAQVFADRLTAILAKATIQERSYPSLVEVYFGGCEDRYSADDLSKISSILCNKDISEHKKVSLLTYLAKNKGIDFLTDLAVWADATATCCLAQFSLKMPSDFSVEVRSKLINNLLKSDHAIEALQHEVVHQLFESMTDHIDHLDDTVIDIMLLNKNSDGSELSDADKRSIYALMFDDGSTVSAWFKQITAKLFSTEPIDGERIRHLITWMQSVIAEAAKNDSDRKRIPWFKHQFASLLNLIEHDDRLTTRSRDTLNSLGNDQCTKLLTWHNPCPKSLLQAAIDANKVDPSTLFMHAIRMADVATMMTLLKKYSTADGMPGISTDQLQSINKASLYAMLKQAYAACSCYADLMACMQMASLMNMNIPVLYFERAMLKLKLSDDVEQCDTLIVSNYIKGFGSGIGLRRAQLLISNPLTCKAILMNDDTLKKIIHAYVLYSGFDYGVRGTNLLAHQVLQGLEVEDRSLLFRECSNGQTVMEAITLTAIECSRTYDRFHGDNRELSTNAIAASVDFYHKEVRRSIPQSITNKILSCERRRWDKADSCSYALRYLIQSAFKHKDEQTIGIILKSMEIYTPKETIQLSRFKLIPDYDDRLFTNELTEDGCSDETMLSLGIIYGLSNKTLYRLVTASVRHDHRNSNGMSALDHAIDADNIMVARELLKLHRVKHSLNERDNHGQTALSRAIQKGNQTMVSMLLDTGVSYNAGYIDLKQTYGDDRQTVLHRAIEAGDTNVLAELLKEPAVLAIINEPNAHGYTALSLACIRSRMDLAELLINAGAADQIARVKDTQQRISDVLDAAKCFAQLFFSTTVKTGFAQNTDHTVSDINNAAGAWQYAQATHEVMTSAAEIAESRGLGQQYHLLRSNYDRRVYDAPVIEVLEYDMYERRRQHIEQVMEVLCDQLSHHDHAVESYLMRKNLCGALSSLRNLTEPVKIQSLTDKQVHSKINAALMAVAEQQYEVKGSWHSHLSDTSKKRLHALGYRFNESPSTKDAATSKMLQQYSLFSVPVASIVTADTHSEYKTVDEVVEGYAIAVAQPVREIAEPSAPPPEDEQDHDKAASTGIGKIPAPKQASSREAHSDSDAAALADVDIDTDHDERNKTQPQASNSYDFSQFKLQAPPTHEPVSEPAVSADGPQDDSSQSLVLAN